jgi:hypothetical protein
MKHLALILTILLSARSVTAQEYQIRANIDKDSLFNASIKSLPEEMREEYTRIYKEGDEQAKEFLLFMISMPRSSKRELIRNYEDKRSEILRLKQEYQKYVPKHHIVEIEFEPESKILTVGEEITIKVYKIQRTVDKSHVNKEIQRNDKLKVVSQNWNLKPGSKTLEQVLISIGWTNETLIEIKQLLDNANCVSIENGEATTIGFARSGMGKYSYKIFEKSLTQKQKDEHNNGCEYIYYKDNVVLEYGGGAVGPQCFERG